jgi:hypothetical protein
MAEGQSEYIGDMSYKIVNYRIKSRFWRLLKLEKDALQLFSLCLNHLVAWNGPKNHWVCPKLLNQQYCQPVLAYLQFLFMSNMVLFLFKQKHRMHRSFNWQSIRVVRPATVDDHLRYHACEHSRLLFGSAHSSVHFLPPTACLHCFRLHYRSPLSPPARQLRGGRHVGRVDRPVSVPSRIRRFRRPRLLVRFLHSSLRLDSDAHGEVVSRWSGTRW